MDLLRLCEFSEELHLEVIIRSQINILSHKKMITYTSRDVCMGKTSKVQSVMTFGKLHESVDGQLYLEQYKNSTNTQRLSYLVYLWNGIIHL